MSLDLSNLSESELEALKSQIDNEKEARRKASRKEARQACRQTAREYGFTIEELFGGATGSKRTRRSREERLYQHPSDPSLTWSGFGRKPGWLNELVNSGRDVESLRVK